MSKTQTHFAPDERVIYKTRPHWVYTALALIMLAAFTIAGHAFDVFVFPYVKTSAGMLTLNVPAFMRPLPPSITIINAACILTGIFLFVTLMIPSFSEIILTQRRLFYKYGLINVRIKEVELDEIKSQNVNYGLLGWLFRYGKVHIDCRLVEDFDLPAIGRPQKFLNFLQTTKMGSYAAYTDFARSPE